MAEQVFGRFVQLMMSFANSLLMAGSGEKKNKQFRSDNFPNINKRKRFLSKENGNLVHQVDYRNLLV